MGTGSSGDPYQQTQVVRLDQATGTIVARSATVDSAGTPVATADTVWVTGLAGHRPGTGHDTLYRLDPVTLRTTARRVLSPAGYAEQPVTANRGHLWVAVGCTLQRLDPDNGRPDLQVEWPATPAAPKPSPSPAAASTRPP